MVDNGSSDGSVQLDTDFPQTQFIRLPKNFGLTKAMNIGWRAADAACPLLAGDEGRPAPQLGNLPPDGQWRAAEPPSAWWSRSSIHAARPS